MDGVAHHEHYEARGLINAIFSPSVSFTVCPERLSVSTESFTPLTPHLPSLWWEGDKPLN